MRLAGRPCRGTARGRRGPARATARLVAAQAGAGSSEAGGVWVWVCERVRVLVILVCKSSDGVFGGRLAGGWQGVCVEEQHAAGGLQHVLQPGWLLCMQEQAGAGCECVLCITCVPQNGLLQGKAEGRIDLIGLR